MLSEQVEKTVGNSGYYTFKNAGRWTMMVFMNAGMQVCKYMNIKVSKYASF